jgi:ligand-binding SRPBCC domain-containing protein
MDFPSQLNAFKFTLTWVSIRPIIKFERVQMTRLQTTLAIHAPIQRCFDLARSVEAHLAGNVHWGETADADASGLLGAGDRVTWRARHFGIRWRLTSRITGMDRPAWFQDAMVSGPFRYMRHDHYFRALAPDRTEMRDVFCFASPFPMPFLRRYMLALLRERNAAIQSIAESQEWRRYLP